MGGGGGLSWEDAFPVVSLANGGDGGSIFGNGGGFMGEFTGANASREAARMQAEAAKEANATQRYMYDTTRADQAPWRQAGVRALSGLEDADFQRDFSMKDFQADPGYQFRMSEGMKAIEGSAAAKGSLNSGATLKALSRFGQDFASNEFNNAYNRFNADRDRRFNRLASLAGIGQTANSELGAAGQNYANQVSANQIGMGNASAAARMQQQQGQNQLIGQGAMAAAMYFSDRRVKTYISPVSAEDLEELRTTIKPYAFRYLNGDRGDWVGVMAQDLEKSKLGRTVVVEVNGLKMIDQNKLTSLLLATLAKEAA